MRFLTAGAITDVAELLVTHGVIARAMGNHHGENTAAIRLSQHRRRLHGGNEARSSPAAAAPPVSSPLRPCNAEIESSKPGQNVKVERSSIVRGDAMRYSI